MEEEALVSQPAEAVCVSPVLRPAEAFADAEQVPARDAEPAFLPVEASAAAGVQPAEVSAA